MAGLPAISLPCGFDSAGLADRPATDHWRGSNRPCCRWPTTTSRPRGVMDSGRGGTGGLRKSRMIWLQSLIAKPLIKESRAFAHLIEHKTAVATLAC